MTRRERLRPKRRYRPLPVCVVNGCFPVGDRRSEKILTRAALLAPVVLGVEFKSIDGITEDGTPVLDPKVWLVIHDTSDPAHAGSLMAFRRDRCRVLTTRVAVGTRPYLRRDGRRIHFDILTRYMIKAVVLIDGGTPSQRERSFAVAHFPPKRSFPLWGGMARSLRRVDADVTGGDFNKHRRTIARLFPRRTARMIELIGIVARKPLRTSLARAHHVGSDHPAVVVEIR